MASLLKLIKDLPDELKTTIYMFYHPCLLVELKNNIHTFALFPPPAIIFTQDYNALRITSGIGGIRYST